MLFRSEKFISINGNVLYEGKPWDRKKIKDGLEEFFTPFVATLPKLEGPIIMECELYAPLHYHLPDLNNFGYMYEKVLSDTMVNMGKLKDDCVPYITKPGCAPLFIPVESEEDRKLVYHIYQDLRPEILQLTLL